MRFTPGTLNRKQADALNRLMEMVEGAQDATGAGGAELIDGPNGPAFNVNFENAPPGPNILRLKERPDNVIPPIGYSTWEEVLLKTGVVPLDLADGLKGSSSFKVYSVTGVEAPRNMESYPLALLALDGQSALAWIHPVVKFIQILSLVQSPEGFYPAREMTFDPVTLVWIPGEDCWWRDANQ